MAQMSEELRNSIKGGQEEVEARLDQIVSPREHTTRVLNFLFRPGDTADCKLRKQVVTTSLTCAVLFNLLYFASSPDFVFTSTTCGVFTIIIAGSAILSYVLLTKSCTVRLTEWHAFVVLAGVLLIDLNDAASPGHTRTWPAAMILADLLLLTNVTDGAETGLRLCVTAWLIFTSIEDGWRLGVYDSGFVARHTDLVECSSPPCEAGVGTLFRAGFNILIFHLDFVITRRFAQTTRAEKKAMLEAITLGEVIAKSLVDFDLDTATSLVEMSSLPDDLRRVYKQLIENLESYRPYLPESCLGGNEMPCEGCSDFSQTASTVTSGTCRPSTPVVPVAVRFSTNSVTLLAANIRKLLAYDAHHRSTLHTDFLEELVTLVHQGKGVIDGFSGDRVVAMFNASKRCIRHEVSAVRTGVRLVEGQRCYTTAVASGKAQCGNIGCAEVKRFGVLGRVACRVHMMERCAARWELESPLCDSQVYEEVRYHFVTYLLPDTVYFDKEPQALDLWVAHSECSVVDSAEWMYQLESQDDPFEEYHRYVAQYRRGTHGMKHLLSSNCPPGVVRYVAGISEADEHQLCSVREVGIVYAPYRASVPPPAPQLSGQLNSL
eukprot:Sspe_Gene.24102::Locus_9474_Transcript_1_1_Confidence_1.000_Length_2296::g.24102::m.24102